MFVLLPSIKACVGSRRPGRKAGSRVAPAPSQQIPGLGRRGSHGGWEGSRGGRGPLEGEAASGLCYKLSTAKQPSIPTLRSGGPKSPWAEGRMSGGFLLKAPGSHFHPFPSSGGHAHPLGSGSPPTAARAPASVRTPLPPS